jgi:peptidoglycan/LPS O-acetylase OafA/YrhL
MERKLHYFAIDVLRFVAAALVLGSHFGTFKYQSALSADADGPVAFPFLAGLHAVGGVGVEIFFVISGFVIVMSIDRKSGATGALQFLKARALRIFPVLWISSLISLCFVLLAGGDIGDYWASTVRSMILSPVGPYIDGVVWSLVVEVVFYALISAVILVRPRVSLDVVAICLGVASSLYLLLLTWATLTHHHALVAGLSRFPYKVFLLQHGVLFAIGMLMWSIRSRGLTIVKGSCTALFLVPALLECFLKISRSAPPEYGVVAAGIWVVAMVFMAAGIFHAQAIAKRLHWCRHVLQYLGALSYPIYLNNYATGMVVTWFLFDNGIAPVAALSIGVAFVLCLASLVLGLEKQIHGAVKMRLVGRREVSLF